MHSWQGNSDVVALGLAALVALAGLALLRADRSAGVAVATLARLGTTLGVIVRYALIGMGWKLRGRREVGPELVRRAFEDLGPTYLKLGQLIASSHGLFPEAYCRELGKTLDRVKPFAFAEVERTLAVELRAQPHKLFATLDEKPLASASIAQVHAATLPDGRQVVVKIQRPHLQRRVAADMRILRLLAQVISIVPTVELANPVGVIDDFDTTLHEELDFTREAANLREFNGIMRELGHGDVRAPQVVDELTTTRVLTMERFFGVRIDDVEVVRARVADTEAKLVHGLHAWFQCMVLYGFFHGDVHAGNLMMLDDGALGFLDFGIIGRFDPKTRALVTEYLFAFSAGDYKSLVRVMMQMDAMGSVIDADAVAADLAKAFAPILTTSFGDLNYAEVLPGILRVSVKHKMRMPREFVLVTKQMLYFDRYAKLLAPKLNIFSDPRLIAAISVDVMRARMAAQQSGVL